MRSVSVKTHKVYIMTLLGMHESCLEALRTVTDAIGSDASLVDHTRVKLSHLTRKEFTTLCDEDQAVYVYRIAR